MLKWTSRTRGRLFDSITFTPLDGLDISRGIPKLDGTMQSKAAMLLLARSQRFAAFARSSERWPQQTHLNRMKL
jgi:hypothetical protein